MDKILRKLEAALDDASGKTVTIKRELLAQAVAEIKRGHVIEDAAVHWLAAPNQTEVHLAETLEENPRYGRRSDA